MIEYPFTPVRCVPVKQPDGGFEMRYVVAIPAAKKRLPGSERVIPLAKPEEIAAARKRLADERIAYLKRNKPRALDVATDWRERTHYGERGTRSHVR